MRWLADLRGWLFLSPGLIALTLFVLIPAGYVIFLSLLHWNLLDPQAQFVGLKNYIGLLSAPDFQQALLNTLYLGVGLLLTLLPLGLLLAVLLDMKLRATKVYRTILFAPYALPLVASGLAWAWLYSPNYGLINQILAAFHIAGPNWLGSSTWSLPAILFVTVWQYTGYYTIIFLSGLQSVSSALKEAASVDGANPWQTFWHVTLPSLSPTMFFAFVVCTIQAVQTFDQVYVMTDGGPQGGTTTLVYFIYNQGFQMYNIGAAAAASIYMLLFLALLTWLQIRLSRRWVVDAS